MQILKENNLKKLIPPVLDALPYIDPLRSIDLRKQVNLVVTQEMKKFEPRNYLIHIPMPKIKESLILQKEIFHFIQEKKIKVLDENRYKVLGPSKEQINVLSAWKISVENVQARISEEQNVITN